LIADSEAFARPKSFRAVWLASFLFWLATDYFVTLPHWAGWFGWVAMSGYLALYIPLFFAASRGLHHRWGMPLVVAAPVAWVGMEFLRAHLLTGFGMAMLPHAMYRVPALIQTADLVGGYGTSFLQTLAAAALVEGVRSRGWRRIGSVILCCGTVGGALAYGGWRLSYSPSSAGQPVSVALIQGSRDVRFELTPEEARRAWEAQFREYRDLTVAARRRWPDLHLVIWPESAFPQVDPIPNRGEARLDPEQRAEILAMRRSTHYCCQVGLGLAPLDRNESRAALLTDSIPLLTGGQSHDAVRAVQFNSAFLFDRSHEICFRYYKMHLVMFGEYIPLGDWFPFVYQWSVIPGGLAAGTEARAFEIGGIRFAPSICFESTVGHLIRSQVIALKSVGREPDVLVNLTNDGWFYGSNCLDLHLACNVFRAIEQRKPMLVAANTGFSAHIDGSGRLLQVGPRRKPDVLRAEVRRDGRTSLYQILGDWPALGLTVLALLGLLRPNWFHPNRAIVRGAAMSGRVARE
jgi:apolipoprotein N-acyltransferase